MSTVRAYVNKKRIATARQINSSNFQQFFPAKVSFKNEKEWKDIVNTLYGGSAIFQVENNSAPTPSLTPSSIPIVAPQEQKSSSDTILNIKDWKYDSQLTHIFPSGTYWIGDICYCLSDKMYDNIFGGFGYSSGIYTHKDGGVFMVDSTAWGDGCYLGSDGVKYGVDAGIIGIVSEKLIQMSNGAIGGGKIYQFTNPVTCNFKKGVFRFVSGDKYIKINTQ